MNPGRFDEQPMPETTRTLWGAIFESSVGLPAGADGNGVPAKRVH